MGELQRTGIPGTTRIDWPTWPAASRQRDPILVVNPPDDQAFVNAVRSAYQSGARTPEALRRALQAVYPDIVVRPRDLAEEMFAAWYVYRDGRWTPRRSAGARRS